MTEDNFGTETCGEKKVRTRLSFGLLFHARFTDQYDDGYSK